MEKRYLEFKRGKTSIVGMDATKCEALERFGFDWTENVATAELEAEAVEAPAAMDMGMGVSPSPGTMSDSNSTVEDNANTSSFESSTVETAVPHATQHDPQWLEMLQQFKDSYPEGNLPTETTLVYTTTPLEEWMTAQQSAYEKYMSGETDGLTEERINLLTGAGFLFESQFVFE